MKTEIKTLMQDVINTAVENIQKQQDELIKKRLNRILGYDLDIKEEVKRRFPRIGVFQQENETSYYWNDGSIDGIRIITFIQEPIDFKDINDMKLTIGLSYK